MDVGAPFFTVFLRWCNDRDGVTIERLKRKLHIEQQENIDIMVAPAITDYLIKGKERWSWVACKVKLFSVTFLPLCSPLPNHPHVLQMKEEKLILGYY